MLLESQDAQKALVLLGYLFNADKLQNVCREDWLQQYDKQVLDKLHQRAISCTPVVLCYTQPGTLNVPCCGAPLMREQQVIQKRLPCKQPKARTAQKACLPVPVTASPALVLNQSLTHTLCVNAQMTKSKKYRAPGCMPNHVVVPCVCAVCG